ncbi:hypothetical protein ACNKHP_02280 [Shigella boydii]
MVIRCPSKRVSSVCWRVDRRSLCNAGSGNCRTSRRSGGTHCTDMPNALRLHDEMSEFTDEVVMNLADWETLPYDSFSPHQDIISSAFHPLPATDDAAWRTDCSGEYPYAAGLPTQFFSTVMRW